MAISECERVRAGGGGGGGGGVGLPGHPSGPIWSFLLEAVGFTVLF